MALVSEGADLSAGAVVVHAVPSAAGVGDYIAINRMKVHDSEAWNELETKIWKPIQEARVKDGQLRAWSSYELILPSGTGQPYSALTADVFPSWDAMWKQKPLDGYVNKAHPHMSQQEFGEKTSKARDLVSREVFKVIVAAGSMACWRG